MDSRPCSWLIEHSDLFQAPGDVLDLACGLGRHALWLASQGMSVTAIDRDVDALARVQQSATSLGLVMTTRVQDLEIGAVSLGTHVFDAIVVVHYLHRPLFPALLEALRPGGLLVYQTFTRAQAALGKPTNPDFLLEPGELRRLIPSLEVLDAREGFFDGRHVASIVARKPEAVRHYNRGT